MSSDDESTQADWDRLPEDTQQAGEAVGGVVGATAGQEFLGPGGGTVSGAVGGELGGAAGWAVGYAEKTLHDLGEFNFGGSSNDPYGGQQPPGGIPPDYQPEGGLDESTPDGGA